MRKRTARARWNIWSALLLVVALAAAACAPQSVNTTAGTNTTATVDTSASLGDTLNIATWPNYHDPETIKQIGRASCRERV